jgi:predicted secreted Zn-dependent protease
MKRRIISSSWLVLLLVGAFWPLAACSQAPATVNSQPTLALPTPTLLSEQTLIPTWPVQAAPSPVLEALPVSSAAPLPLPSPIGTIQIPGANMVYYTIYGSTETELRKQLDAKQPVGFDGYRGDSTTSWDINWTWPGHGKFICDLAGATVTLKVTVIFPRWNPPLNASPELVTKWTKYVEVLAFHEGHHVDSVNARYKTVETAIKGATCLTADAAARKALDPIYKYDIDYDAATNHGETEGARFP